MPLPPLAASVATPLLDTLRRPTAGAQTGIGTKQPGIAAPTSPTAPTFASALDNALRAVSASQQEATTLAEGFQSDPGSVSLEQAMVALQRSQIGFQSALHVRNRLVSAYTDIMNMQV